MDKRDQSCWAKDDLIGGHPVLDFLNTAGGKTKLRDVERLIDFETFLEWSVVANVLSEREAHALKGSAHGEPAAADAALADARCFREALHCCFIAEQANQDWPKKQRGQVMAAIRDSLLKAHLEKHGEHYEWTIPERQSNLTLPLIKIVLATEALLRSDDLARMRNCDHCSWLFIDRGRGRARRWCSMAACGSRAKSARYYRRRMAEPS